MKTFMFLLFIGMMRVFLAESCYGDQKA